MTRHTENVGTEFDPEGSIFLPKTSNPVREFDNWRLQLLLGRGIAEGKTLEEITELDRLVQAARSRHMGSAALLAE
jgi:hypothetical protein